MPAHTASLETFITRWEAATGSDRPNTQLLLTGLWRAAQSAAACAALSIEALSARLTGKRPGGDDLRDTRHIELGRCRARYLRPAFEGKL